MIRTIPCFLLLASLASCQLVEVHAEPDLTPLRDVADAIGYHLVEARGEGPLVSTQLDAREAIHVEPGAVQIDMPPGLVKVQPQLLLARGAIQVSVPVDEAARILEPLIAERSQQLLDDMRTSYGRDSREIAAAVRWLAIAVSAGVLLMAVGVAWERFTDNSARR